MFAKRTNWNLTANRLSEAQARHRASGKALLDLSASNPTECGFQYASHAIMRALCSPRTIEYRPDPKGLDCASGGSRLLPGAWRQGGSGEHGSDHEHQ